MSDQPAKAPSQIFRWFEKMKNNYELQVQKVLQHFEQYSERQQNRLDNAHQKQIAMLEQQLTFYQQQIIEQQKTINALNTRYDAVISQLLTKNQPIDYRDLFAEVDDIDEKLQLEAQVNHADNIQQTTTSPSDLATNTQPSLDNETEEKASLTGNEPNLFEQAINYRNEQQFELAIAIFTELALENNPQAMGALGRAYFLGEGVEVNAELGLAWLIKAAELNLPQAIKRVNQLKQADESLFEQAEKLAQTLPSLP